MPVLLELQRRCYDAFVLGRTESIASLVANDASMAGVCIYQNNALEVFRKTLAAAFPVVARLTGPDCFRTLSRDYMQACPSRSGNLEGFGARFASFLAATYRHTDYAYLSDVARLEWACEEALCAADAPPLDAARLANVAPDAVRSLEFQLHPSCRLVSSPWPVLSIWRANNAEVADERIIHLDAGAEAVLVCRTADGLMLHPLPSADAAFVAAFQDGAHLAGACDAAAGTDPGFDPGPSLRRLLAWGALSDFSFSTPATSGGFAS